MAEKKQELEKRLQDVAVQLGSNKKQQPKKGIHFSILEAFPLLICALFN
jgi:hypothetical protein